MGEGAPRSFEDEVAELRRRNARLEQEREELLQQLVKVKGELHRSRAHAASLSTIDVDTGLLQWRAFEERAIVEIARASRHDHATSLAAIAIEEPNDLDPNAAMRSIASVLRDQQRISDISGRSEEDEVLVLLPETTIHGAHVLVERICSLVKKRHGIVARGGCAAWPNDGRAFGSLVLAARRARSHRD
jgi:GGDEF domain-containing protein